MLTDIEIAAQAKMKRITDVAAAMGIRPEELEPYGHYKAKLSDDLLTRLQDRPDGKLVLVTAVNPTPAGEGKTTVSIGLGQAMCKLGKNAVIALREPSLGPVFGIRAALPAAVTARWCLWRTLTCTLPVICMPLPVPII